MKWSDKYATGNEIIDDQHKMIFRMADEFREALDHNKGEEAYIAILQSLNYYVGTHFSYEEQLMDERSCPAAEKNKDEHKKFIGTLIEYEQRFSENGYDRTDAYSLVDTIDSWLSEHICCVDMELKQ